jgi:LDH2 family malate/lactate/ureidoglycolate dehydrogenase
MLNVGHTCEEATIISDHLIDSELRGLSFGGLPRALSTIDRIKEQPAPRQPITVVRETPVSATLDGGEQVGYLVGLRATEIALQKARQSGIAVVGASKTWYTGMFSYYLEKVTNAGFVGMIAGSGGQKVAPHGGTEPRFSTNPIAFGFPSSETPIIWDIGTASIMLGEVMLHKRLGTQFPEGHAFDPEGNPTCDPDKALKGAFTVWGGHKGSGLAMVVQLLGMLAGQAIDAPSLRDCGFLIVVIDPGVLVSSSEYQETVAQFARLLRQTRPADPASPVRVPFERSVAQRKARLEKDEIEVTELVYEQLMQFVSTSAVGHG